MAARTRWAATFVVLASALLYPIVVKIRRRSQKPRPDGIQVLSDRPDAKFQIVAVHGLGAHPDHTWTANSARVNAGRPEKVHLLRDLLKHDFPDARVLSFAHNSDWLIDAPVKTAQQIGDRLLEQLKANQPAQRLPTIFIGHSFGGIIIKEALCKPGSQEIIDDTCGIIFLGTPHQGSSVSVFGAVVAFLTGFLGSNTTLLLSLKRHQDQLSDLADAFRTSMAQKEDRRQKEGRRQKAKIMSFYETKPTYLLGWLSIGLVVTRDSATVHADETIDIDTDHSGLNKCSEREAELYKQLEKAILDLQAPSLLDEADEWIRKKHYTPDKLKIERLSSDSLPIDQCYINLAIVEQPSRSTGRSGGDAAHPSSPFSLLARQKVETPDKKIQSELPAIFHPRKGPNGDMTHPRRILIRGRAGVGKTTLCKKIVHEFARGAWCEWSELFDRVLWVPLRNLKLEERRQAGYNFENLFYHEYFSGQGRDHGSRLANELRQTLETKSSKTLFLLDGLDEVSQDMSRDDDMSRFLKELLNQPNVIITSRPHAELPDGLKVDLEVETIGFYPEQVEDYIKMAFTNRETGDVDQGTVNEVQSFLRKHWLVQSLVRIPIQLDALCFAWNTGFDSEKLDTMTALYQAIEQSLWRKDIKFPRLEKKPEDYARNAGRSEIKRTIEPETTLLQCLAFTGLSSDVIDFTSDHRDKISELFNPLESHSKLSLHDTLANLSFLRTSDPSSEHRNRNYHFLHLTFQEYFAAQYFVRRLKTREDLEYLELIGPGKRLVQKTKPIEFLRKHKYTARYDVLWRFVAGLLSAEGEAETFFRMIEEPRDLLGPTHQRLVMHCLSEVSTEMPLREGLEEKLAQWLLFECEFTNRSYLASEMEFPEPALHAALQKEPDAVKIIILRSLARRPRIPPRILELGTWLGEDVSDTLKKAVCNMLQNAREYLPNDTTEAVAAWLEDQDADIRGAAADALGQRSDLPVAILEAVAARLWDRDDDVRIAAAYALGQRSDLPVAILEAVAARLGDEDDGIRITAVHALGQRSDLPVAILEAVAARLGDAHADVRIAAVHALGQRSDLPVAILEALAARLWDQDAYVRGAAAQALGRRSDLPVAILEALAARLGDAHADVRNTATRALGQQSDLPVAILKALAARLEDQDVYVRRAAARALGRQSDLPVAILEALAARLGDQEDADVSDLAEVSLRRHRDFYSTLLNSPSVKSLYEIFLRRSFTEQWSWYVEGDKCYQMGSEEFEWEVSGEFKNMVSRARPAFMPSMNGGVA